MNILEFLFGFPVSACNVEQGTCYVLVFCGCRWEFVPYSQMSGEQQLSINCATNELTITGTGGNTVDLSCLCISTPLFLDVDNILYANFGTACETSVDLNSFLPVVNLMIDILYADLVIAIGLGTLVEGATYRITDYQTIHFFPGTEDVNTAVIEPIIVDALSPSEISNIAKSQTFPQDIIYYDRTRSSVTNGGTTITRPGWIYRRIDTEGQIDVPCDWRNVMQYRYLLDLAAIPLWDVGTPYAANTVVRHTDNVLYISSTSVGNTGQLPGIGSEYWTQMIYQINTTYRLAASATIGSAGNTLMIDAQNASPCYMFAGGASVRDFTIDGLNPAYYPEEIPNFVVFGGSISGMRMRDAHNITMFNPTINNVEVGYNFYDNLMFWNIFNSDLGGCFYQNIAFGMLDTVLDGHTIQNTIRSMQNMHVSPYFIDNRVEAMYGVEVGADVQTNYFHNIESGTIEGEMKDNQLLGLIKSVTFGVQFRNNYQAPNHLIEKTTFGPSCGNTTGNSFHGLMRACTFGPEMHSNNLSGPMDNCTFGYEFYSNTLFATGSLTDCHGGNRFASNVITNIISRTTFGESFQANLFGVIGNAVNDTHFGNNIQAKAFDLSTRLTGLYDKDVRFGSDINLLFCTFLDPAGNIQVEDALA